MSDRLLSAHTSVPVGLRANGLWIVTVPVVIYMHTMHAWLTVPMLCQMHGRALHAVHMLIVCMGIF